MTGKRPRGICPECGADVALFENKGYAKVDAGLFWGQHSKKGRGKRPQCPKSGKKVE